jgi:6-phosphogluconate dehydrogenase
MPDHGFSVTGDDKDPGKFEALQKESKEHSVHGAVDIKGFIGLLCTHRAVMMLVITGDLNDLGRHPQPGDLIFDSCAIIIGGHLAQSPILM